jgi:hypothetical protein
VEKYERVDKHRCKIIIIIRNVENDEIKEYIKKLQTQDDTGIHIQEEDNNLDSNVENFREQKLRRYRAAYGQIYIKGRSSNKEILITRCPQKR